MTTNRILVLNAIQAHPGLTDGELRNLTGVEPHQQVNQICRSLAAAGLTRRISGAYGLLLADEPIGTYDRHFSLADWPGGLLEGCLPAAVRHMEADQVIAFCARTTGYGKLLRSVDWRRHGVGARIVCPQTDGRGGAQVLVPRALGEAVFAYLHAELTSKWHSSAGIPLAV